MRTQRSGTILTISSIGGLIGLPYQAIYSATKFALEGLMEGLSLEVRQFGISVILVEPGDIRTKISQNRIFSSAAQNDSGYALPFKSYVQKITYSEENAPGPDVVARSVYRALSKKTPGLRYKVATVMERLGVVLRTILPARLFERILASNYKI